MRVRPIRTAESFLKRGTPVLRSAPPIQCKKLRRMTQPDPAGAEEFLRLLAAWRRDARRRSDVG